MCLKRNNKNNINSTCDGIQVVFKSHEARTPHYEPAKNAMIAAIITDKITDGPAIDLATYPTTRNTPTLNVPPRPTFVKSNAPNNDDAAVACCVDDVAMVRADAHELLLLTEWK